MKEPTPPGCVGWYDSGEECCSSYLGRECPMIDVSGDTTSTEATMPVSSCDEWHIVPTNKYVCTNSEDYPPVWKEHYYEIFFFETADACCGTVEGGCKEVVNVCASCTEEYSPVCGSDASTYDNSCKAEAAGIKEYVSGTCEQVAEATTTTTTTTPATTTTTTSKTTTTTTTPATTTTTTPATTTSTTTTSSTTPLTTTTSTTTTTTTSDPGDMQQNSGSGSTTTPYRCSDHKRRRPCSRAEKYGCNWDRSERVCRHNDEIVANSEGSHSVYKRSAHGKDQRHAKRGASPLLLLLLLKSQHGTTNNAAVAAEQRQRRGPSLRRKDKVLTFFILTNPHKYTPLALERGRQQLCHTPHMVVMGLFIDAPFWTAQSTCCSTCSCLGDATTKPLRQQSLLVRVVVDARLGKTGV
eukprot:scaffold103_cov147-Skeletonema_menzelii.AAC.4